MSIRKNVLSITVLITVAAMFSAQAAAQVQDASNAERERIESAERAELSMREAAQEQEANAAKHERIKSAERAELSMREAEKQLEEAAQRIAELSSAEIARVGEIDNHWVTETSRPVLGITIGSADDRRPGEKKGPVEGVSVIGITPGGAADEAGIRSGDTITAINGESLSSSSEFEAIRSLLDIMHGVEEGELLNVDYLRANKQSSVEVTPQTAGPKVLNFRVKGGPNMVMDLDGAPVMPGGSGFAWIGRSAGHGFGEMEMVELNASLGRYFGTDSGLLIVKAPQDNSYQLEDGDVLKSIDGRTPENLRHAIRILSSYESGETVNLKILRDKKEKTIKVDVPDNQRSSLRVLPETMPASFTGPIVEVAPKVRIVTRIEEST